METFLYSKGINIVNFHLTLLSYKTDVDTKVCVVFAK